MEKLGFKEITKKSMLHSVGKIMTIPKGAKINNISMMNVITSLMDCGFEITGEMPDSTFTNKLTLSNIEMDGTQKSRTEQIKSYLKRLSAGESLDAVRTDFVREFEKVEPSEIIKAEQELLNEGTPISEVQRLCDVHSALFHGLTTEEKFSNDNSKSSDSNYRKRAEEALAKLDSFQRGIIQIKMPLLPRWRESKVIHFTHLVRKIKYFQILLQSLIKAEMNLY